MMSTTTADRRAKGATWFSRHGRRVVLAAMVLVVALVAGGSSASASLVHPFVRGFDGSQTPAGSMTPFGVAVDNSSSVSAGDVYVTDLAHVLVDKFEGSGTYTFLSPIEGVSGELFSGVPFYTQDAVNASGDVFVGEALQHVVDEFEPNGTYLSRVQLPSEALLTAVAVDGSGEVLAAEGGKVYKYDPGTASVAEFATGTPGGAFGDATGVAVDDDPSSPAFGDVYVVDSANNVVDVFDSSGTYLSQLTPAGGFSFAFRDVVDPASGDLYVTNGNMVDEFDPTGKLVTETSLPEGGAAFTVAAGTKTGDLYVGDIENSRVDVFGAAVTIPDVRVTGVSGVTPLGATVEGSVDPAGGGNVTACVVEYGTSTAYGEAQPCAQPLPYAAPAGVSVALNGLAVSTAYHFRFKVSNANGVPSYSEDGTFETNGPPTIGEPLPPVIGHTTATLREYLNPHGIQSTYHFEYGPTSSYGSSVPVPDGNAGSGTTEEAVSTEIGGLALDTTYHYRLVARNTEGVVVDGSDETFTTDPVANVESQTWIAGPHDAALKAKVEDFGVESGCEVEYVSQAQFAAGGYAAPTITLCTPMQLAGMEGELHAVARPQRLAANTTYHFRFVVSNHYGVRRSADQTLVTFGVAGFSFEALDQEGRPDTQAGGHPYALTTNIDLSTNTNAFGVEGPGGQAKDITAQLPPGLIGNPQATPKCARYASERKACSGASEVGRIAVRFEGNRPGDEVFEAPVFNMVPPRGVAAEFSARINNIANAILEGSVRTGSDYGFDVGSLNIGTKKPITGVSVTFWGVPADSSHDAKRSCAEPSGYRSPCEANAPLRPFLRNPTSCSGPLSVGVSADTWQAPGEFEERSTGLPALTGCENVPFKPSLNVQAESLSADSPTGVEADLHLPQEENANGVAEADLKEAVVTLPESVVVNPSAANGLVGCSSVQIELHGSAPARCPDASRVGSVEIDSPLADHPLTGGVFVASPGDNPFGSLLAVYIAVDDPATGVVLKLAGHIEADPVSGRLLARFGGLPQIPFEDVKLHFFGGPSAVLATPPACGTYTVASDMTPWSAPQAPDAFPSSSFQVTSGANGGGCGPMGFAPAFSAGTTSNHAGAFGALSVSLSRQDGEQELGGVHVTTPPGVSAILKGVERCGEPQASEGACPAGSLVGHASAAAGVGSNPVWVQNGQVFLTGPYKGAPFGLSFVVPAVAGPFDLGNVVVRAAVSVDPHTAQVSVVSDPLPTILQGIPLQVRNLNVTIDRPGFMFNPTDCEPLAVTGTLTSTQGATAAVSSHFQAANCATLPFKPAFAASTQARTSKQNGASLTVKGSFPAGEANIHSVAVVLPKQLPARLTTIQQACTEAQFNQNPAGCPVASNIGTATASTPILANPVVGPVYLVSHGGAAFPDVVAILQGEGVTVDLTGSISIKKGVTSSDFASVPDVPISSFQLNLPEGPHSSLAAVLPAKAKGNLCGQKLTMPFTITGQNGAQLKPTAKIAVTGCPKTRAKKHPKGRKKHPKKKR